MTTLTSPFLAAVTACLVLACYASQVQQANIVRGVLMDILVMHLMQGTVNLVTVTSMAPSQRSVTLEQASVSAKPT